MSDPQPEWLSFEDPPTTPVPPPIVPEGGGLLSQPAATRIIALPAGLSHWHYALSELEATLASWSLPAMLARRWLHGAEQLLDGGRDLELYVELDPVIHLVSVELWGTGGARLYGIDDFLGSPELAGL